MRTTRGLTCAACWMLGALLFAACGGGDDARSSGAAQGGDGPSGGSGSGTLVVDTTTIVLDEQGTKALHAYLTVDGTKTDVSHDVAWTSSDPTHVTVSGSAVEGVASGDATLTASLGNESAIALVHVRGWTPAADLGEVPLEGNPTYSPWALRVAAGAGGTAAVLLPTGLLHYFDGSAWAAPILVNDAPDQLEDRQILMLPGGRVMLLWALDSNSIVAQTYDPNAGLGPAEVVFDYKGGVAFDGLASTSDGSRAVVLVHEILVSDQSMTTVYAMRWSEGDGWESPTPIHSSSSSFTLVRKTAGVAIDEVGRAVVAFGTTDPDAIYATFADFGQPWAPTVTLDAMPGANDKSCIGAAVDADGSGLVTWRASSGTEIMGVTIANGQIDGTPTSLGVSPDPTYGCQGVGAPLADSMPIAYRTVMGDERPLLATLYTPGKGAEPPFELAKKGSPDLLVRTTDDRSAWAFYAESASDGTTETHLSMRRFDATAGWRSAAHLATPGVHTVFADARRDGTVAVAIDDGVGDSHAWGAVYR